MVQAAPLKRPPKQREADPFDDIGIMGQKQALVDDGVRDIATKPKVGFLRGVGRGIGATVSETYSFGANMVNFARNCYDCARHYGFGDERAKQRMKRTTDKAGLDFDEMSDAWMCNGGQIREKVSTSWVLGAAMSLTHIQAMNRDRPGAAKHMHDTYNMKVFGRYSQAALFRIYDEDKAGVKPDHSAMVIAPQDDHNGAFYESPHVYDEMVKLGGRIYEAGSKNDVARAVLAQRKRFGPIDYAYVAGHGSPESIQFGLGKPGRMELTDLENMSDRWGNAFAPDAQIVLMSCSTGKAKGEHVGLVHRKVDARGCSTMTFNVSPKRAGMGETLSEKLERDVTAPAMDTNIVDLRAEEVPGKKPKLVVNYEHGEFIKREYKKKAA